MLQDFKPSAVDVTGNPGLVEPRRDTTAPDHHIPETLGSASSEAPPLAAASGTGTIRLMNDQRGVIYQHPLAYLLGMEGIALLHAFGGEYDEQFTLERIEECRALLEMSERLGSGGFASPQSTQDGYRDWALCYDSPGNQLIDIEQPIVWEILDGLPVGVALDAACGTGRHAARLTDLGHIVIGVDNSQEMLGVASEKIADADFCLGELDRLPMADHSVDTVVCALALTHVPDLSSVFQEFARVLRPGGHLVTSDSRGLLEDVGLPMPVSGPDGRAAYMPVWQRRASDYLGVALPLGLEVRRCDEPLRPSPLVRSDGSATEDPAGEAAPTHDPIDLPYIWALHRFSPSATNATYRGLPAAIIWHFQKRTQT
jgi:SAM-dependent methyltransferase